MFERFTDGARRVVVVAQEEARQLSHNYIGSEHILLAITADDDSVAARALESLDISLDRVRVSVTERIPRGQQGPGGHIPFTPSAKKTLELSLREAMQLGHDYIGTEHILLGLIREGEGIAAQVLVELGAELGRTRHQVIEMLSGPSREGGPSLHFESGPGPIVPPAVDTPHGPQAVCSFCGRDLWDAPRHVAGESAIVCETCIDRAAQGLRDAPADQREVLLPPGCRARS